MTKKKEDLSSAVSLKKSMLHNFILCSPSRVPQVATW